MLHLLHCCLACGRSQACLLALVFDSMTVTCKTTLLLIMTIHMCCRQREATPQESPRWDGLQSKAPLLPVGQSGPKQSAMLVKTALVIVIW